MSSAVYPNSTPTFVILNTHHALFNLLSPPAASLDLLGGNSERPYGHVTLNCVRPNEHVSFSGSSALLFSMPGNNNHALLSALILTLLHFTTKTQANAECSAHWPCCICLTNLCPRTRDPTAATCEACMQAHLTLLTSSTCNCVPSSDFG